MPLLHCIAIQLQVLNTGTVTMSSFPLFLPHRQTHFFFCHTSPIHSTALISSAFSSWILMTKHLLFAAALWPLSCDCFPAVFSCRCWFSLAFTTGSLLTELQALLCHIPLKNLKHIRWPQCLCHRTFNLHQLFLYLAGIVTLGILCSLSFAGVHYFGHFHRRVHLGKWVIFLNVTLCLQVQMQVNR